MNDELAEIRISHLEQRIDRLVQELAQGKQGDNVQNAQLQPFVPIPRITGEDQKPFDIETDDDDAKSVVRCIFYWGKEEVELADYSLDEIPATGNATLYLTRTISEGEPVYALTTDEPEEGDEDTAYYKIYDFTNGEVSCDYRATFLSLGGDRVGVDEVSIDRVTAEDAKDKDALQFKNFDNSESDGRQGLVQRIRVVKDGEDSFHLEADGAEVFLVARVKGALKYIPLTGAKEKDPDEVEENPCDHPGDKPGTGEEGGVPAEDDDFGHGGGGGYVGGGGAQWGGVPAGEDTHAGEPCPDCSPTGQGVPAE